MRSSPETILVVDDDALVQTALKAVLERGGYQVVQAADGNACLAQLQQNKVDLVLLDILMPDKEGIETLIEMKRDYPALHVIAMSGGGRRSKSDFLAIAKKFGADATINKGFGASEILELVGTQLRRAA
jgi:CheY-like chemotaxis protein